MEIRTIGVVGAGAMGSGLAQTAAMSGYRVVLQDVEINRVRTAMGSIDTILRKAVSRGKITEEQRQEAIGRISPSDAPGGLAEADFVVEAVFEDLALKRSVFAELDRVCRSEVVLATNTSSMSVTEIAASTGRPDRVVGMHFFNPVPVMRLVEIIHTAVCSEQTVRTAHEVAARMGKTAVEVRKDRPGFIVNRVLMPMLIEAIRVVEEGVATPEEVDKAVTLGLNHPMGPFTLMDFTGVDVCYNVIQYFHQEFGQPQYAPPQLLKELIRAGRLGRKTGKGFL